MVSLAELPNLVGFFSYSRNDDEGDGGAVSALANRIFFELRTQLGRNSENFKLWRDKEALATGDQWKEKLREAVSQSVFFIQMVTPSAMNSGFCRFEFESFIEREKELGRDDLMFPILYVSVPELDAKPASIDPVISIVKERHYDDWRQIRYLDANSPDVRRTVGQFCSVISTKLRSAWISPEERRGIYKHRRVEEQRRIQEIESKRQAELTKPWLHQMPSEPATWRGTFFTSSIEKRECPEGHVRVEPKFTYGVLEGYFKMGAGKTEWFKDDEFGPEMVVVPAGNFKMESSPAEISQLKSDEPDLALRSNNDRWLIEVGSDSQGPQRTVVFQMPFAVAKSAVTFDEWEAFSADGGCNGYYADDSGWGRGRRPVINVTWEEARSYVAWLSCKTGKTYRLLSEAEREYVTRAGTETPFWWGESISTSQANYDGTHAYADGARGGYLGQTLLVESFEQNPWGLYQVHGNVWEWCDDVWHDNYNGAPTDGSARLLDGDEGRRVVRGGAWSSHPRNLRAALRLGISSHTRNASLGFRVCRRLTP